MGGVPRTLIERIEIGGGQLAGVALKQPFAGLFLLASSNKGTLVGESWGPGITSGLTVTNRSRCVSSTLETPNRTLACGVWPLAGW